MCEIELSDDSYDCMTLLTTEEDTLLMMNMMFNNYCLV